MTSIPESTPAKTPRSYYLALLAVCVVYAGILLSLWAYVPGTFGSVDATAKIWQAQQLLNGVALDSGREWTDLQSRHVPDWYVVRIDGHPYTVYLNLFVGMLAGGAYLVGNIAWNLVPLIAGIVTVLVTARMARRHKLVGVADLWKLALVVGFATPIVYYAFVPVEHVLAAAFASVAFLLAAAAATDAWSNPARVRWAHLAVAGICLGLAALTRGECYLLALAMGFVILVVFWPAGWKRMLCAGAAITAGGVVALAAWFAAVPLSFRVQGALVEQGAKTPTPMLSRFWHLLAAVHPGERLAGILGETTATWVGLVGGASLLLATVLAVIAGTRRSWLRHVAVVLLVVGLVVVLASWRVEGLLAACPFLVLVAFLVRRDEGLENPVVALILGTSAFYLVFCGLLLPNAGASQFSPRFLLPVVPALAAVSFALVRNRALAEPGRWLAICLALTLMVALATEAKGVLLLRRGGEISQQTENILSPLPRPFVVFSPTVSQEFYIYRAPRIFLNCETLQAKDEAELDEILTALKQRGAADFTLLTTKDRSKERLDMLSRAGAKVVSRHELPVHGEEIVVSIKAGD